MVMQTTSPDRTAITMVMMLYHQSGTSPAALVEERKEWQHEKRLPFSSYELEFAERQVFPYPSAGAFLVYIGNLGDVAISVKGTRVIIRPGRCFIGEFDKGDVNFELEVLGDSHARVRVSVMGMPDG